MLAEVDVSSNQSMLPSAPSIYFVASTRRLIGPKGVIRITKSEAIVLETLAAGGEVFYDALFAALYHGEMPSTAKTCTRVFISRLRKSLLIVGAGDILKTGSEGGYHLRIPVLVAQS